MKKLPLIFTALFLATAGTQAQPDLLAQIHFAGAGRISADANHLAFTNEFCSVEAQALRVQTADKLAGFFDGWLRQKLNAAAVPANATRLRPLLDDLQSAEWFLDSRVGPDGKPLVAFAIKLDDARAKIWQQNLQPYFTAAPAKSEMSSSGGWFHFNYGNGSDKIRDELARRLAQPDNAWLSLDLNWPRLAQFLPVLQEFDFPKIQAQVAGQGGKLKITGKLTLAQPLPPLEKWRIPADTIHQQLISFTAARGIAPWLSRQPWMQPLLLQPQPDQIFLWALVRIPAQTFAAEPVPDAGAALNQLYQRLTANTGWEKQFMSPVTLVMTNREIFLRGLPPIVMPFAQAVREPAGDFLLGGFFPNGGRPAPLPPELMAHFNPPNLVYYHWEATAERLRELPQFSQLMLVTTRHEQVKMASAAGKWLERIGPGLGTSNTEVTQTAPNELTFIRTSPGGLNAVELMALADWLEAPKFPAFDLRLPPPKFRPGQRPFNQNATPGAPAPAHR